ncbi:PREDICTED: uncharacterized protein LOC101293868 [Fragaria vesca subsp. vesca]
MATTKDPSSDRNLTWQNQTKEDHDDQKATVVETILSRPQFPDEIIYRIIQVLPTKSAVRMSSLSKKFEGAWLSQPVLDFDEGNPHDDTTDNIIQHTKFVNILDKYLDYFHEDEKIVTTMVDEVLSLAVRRSVKELDMSIGGDKQAALYCLTLKNPLSLAKSITTLSLENVTIDAEECKSIIFPSLITMSLKTMRLGCSLISSCPSIEYLSLSSCSMRDGSAPFLVSNSNLKSLKVTYCDFQHVAVVKTNLLESFTFVSESYVRLISLSECRNLKSLSILAQHPQYLYITTCGHSVKATVSSPSLHYIQFTGFSKYKHSIEAQSLARVKITIRHEELNVNEPWEHSSLLRYFLESFASFSGEIVLNIDHVQAQALIFPEDFRNTVSPPLPNLKHLKIIIMSPIWAGNSELMDSLTWIAPSAEIKEM